MLFENMRSVPIGSQKTEWVAHITEVLTDKFQLSSKAKHVLWEILHSAFQRNSTISVEDLQEELRTRKNLLHDRIRTGPELQIGSKALDELQSLLDDLTDTRQKHQDLPRRTVHSHASVYPSRY